VRPDCVFHLAALARREHDFYNVAPFINANILFGTQLLESMRLTECRRMITAGSYLQHVESGECRPFNLYAATKQAFENLLTFYVDVYDVSATLLILCNIYGEDDLRPTLMTDIAAASVTGSTLHLHAREVWIDPVHVEDAAGAFLRAAHIMEDDSSPNGTLTRYSVSSGGYISATELINIFECLSKKRLTVNRATLTSPSRRTKPWSGAFVPGWVPRVEIEAGLSRLLAKQRDKQAMP
jgi:nucleoside-diphosphate-sugar epimerase